MPTVMYGGARGGGKSQILWISRTIDDIEYARSKRKNYRKARHRRADARMVNRLIMEFGLGMKWNGKRWVYGYNRRTVSVNSGDNRDNRPRVKG